MPVKDSRGSGAIAEFLILALVFSSLKDRSSPRDPLVSHDEEQPPGASPRGQRRVYIFIDFDYRPIPSRAPQSADSPQPSIRREREKTPRFARDLHRALDVKRERRVSSIRSRFSAILCIANHLVPIGFTLRTAQFGGRNWSPLSLSQFFGRVPYAYIYFARRYARQCGIYRTVGAPARLKISN